MTANPTVLLTVSVLLSGCLALSREDTLQAPSPARDGRFGFSMALSADGTLLAVGSPGEPEIAAPSRRGSVRIFERSRSGPWGERATLRAFNGGPSDGFGHSVAVSGDGQTLAVGAPSEASAARGVGGDPTDQSAPGAGAVYVFARSNTGTWDLAGYLKASNSAKDSLFGAGLSLSTQGDVLVVGAPGAVRGTSSAGPIDGGAYVFRRSATGEWQEEARLTPLDVVGSGCAYEGADVGWNCRFGGKVSISGDGRTVAVAFPATLGPNVTSQRGAVGVFRASDDNRWLTIPGVFAVPGQPAGGFGSSVALSDDGATLVVGAPRRSRAGRDGLGAPELDKSPLENAGEVTVHRFEADGTWTLAATLESPDPRTSQRFGYSVAVSGDGTRVAASGPGEVEDLGFLLPIVRIPERVAAFERRKGAWNLLTSKELPFTGEAWDALAMSADGHTVALGRPGASPAEVELPSSGAVLVLSE